MGTVIGDIDLNTATGGIVSILTRVGPNLSRVFVDGAVTAPEFTTIPTTASLTGENAVIVTAGPLGDVLGGTRNTGGDLTMTNSEMWISSNSATAGGGLDIGGAANTWSFTDGQINFNSTTEPTNGGPFLRSHGTASTNFDLTGTTFNNYGSTNPGLNLAGVVLAGSSLNRVTFNGIWVNIPADLPLIGVNFSNSIFRPNQFYHLRLNAAVGATTTGSFIAGSNLNNFGELAGGGAAGLQLFGDIDGTATNFRGIYLIDCELRATGGLVVNSSSAPAVGTLVATMQSWRPELQNAGARVIDARLKFDTAGAVLYNAPTALTETYDVDNFVTPNNLLIHQRGYYRRDQMATISSTNTATTLDYTDLSTDDRFVFMSYTDLIASNVWTYANTRSGVDTATGLPNTLDVKNTITDQFLQGITLGSVPSNGLAQSTPNGHYRQIKRDAYNSTTLYDWSNIVSNYNGATLTFDGAVNLSTTLSTIIGTGVDPSTFTFRVDASARYGADTATGAITGLVATGFDLANTAIDNLTLSTVGQITNPLVFATRPTDTTASNSFNNCTLTGTIVANSTTTDTFLVLNNCTRDGTLTINRGTGTGTIFVVGAPAGTTFGAGVAAAPPQFLLTSNIPAGVIAPNQNYGIFLYTYVPTTSFEYKAEANNTQLLGDGSASSFDIAIGERTAAVYVGQYWETQIVVFDPVTVTGITHAQDLLLDRAISQTAVSVTNPQAQLIRDTLSPTQSGNAQLSSGMNPGFLQFRNSSTSPGTPADINRIVAGTRVDFTIPTVPAGQTVSSARVYADMIMAAFIQEANTPINFPDTVSTQINNEYLTLDSFEVSAQGASVAQQINGVFFRGDSGVQARAIAGASLNATGTPLFIPPANRLTAVPIPANNGSRTDGEQIHVSADSFNMPSFSFVLPDVTATGGEVIDGSVTVDGVVTNFPSGGIQLNPGQTEVDVATSLNVILDNITGIETNANAVRFDPVTRRFTAIATSRASGATLTITFTTFTFGTDGAPTITTNVQQTFVAGTYSYNITTDQWSLIADSGTNTLFHLLNVTPSVTTDYDTTITAPVLADLLDQNVDGIINRVNAAGDVRRTQIESTVYAANLVF